jgi:hypothetical protein
VKLARFTAHLVAATVANVTIVLVSVKPDNLLFAMGSFLCTKKPPLLTADRALVSLEDEDHHCIWLNNCIGRRNYRYFLIFVSTASIYALYTSAICLTHLLLLYRDHKRYYPGEPSNFQHDALAKAPVSALVMILAFILGLAVGALATYHFWLATVNRTTHEQVIVGQSFSMFNIASGGKLIIANSLLFL